MIPTGQRIKAPDGVSLIELVRSKMSDETITSNDIEAGVIGINYRSFALIKKLLILKDRGTLSDAELANVDKALDVIESKRSYREAMVLTYEIINRHWQKKTRTGEPRTREIVRIRNKTKNRIENTVFAIREACANNDGIELPPWLSKEERLKLRDSVVESMGALWKLFEILNGESDV